MHIPISLTSKGKDSPELRLELISSCLDNEKAEDIVIYDLRGKTPVADYMIIATGRSTTHVKALSDKIIDKCKASQIKDVKAEGLNQGDWALVDVGDVIVHLFRNEVREFYDMDRLWQECQMDSKSLKTLQLA